MLSIENDLHVTICIQDNMHAICMKRIKINPDLRGELLKTVFIQLYIALNVLK